jgi:hypothetical protein
MLPITHKTKYREFCKREPSIPIFSKDWWLDAVCGDDNWDVCLIERGDIIVSILPYQKIQNFNQLYLVMPKLTQTLGPWIRPSKAKYANMLAEQKDLMTELINQLPSFDYFFQNFHYSITNWLPFYWHGFSQTTRYTYVLEDLSDIAKVWDGLLPNIRTDIKKAKSRFGVEVRDDFCIEEFFDVNKLTFARQNMKMPYDLQFVKHLDDVCVKHNSRKIFYGKDKGGKIHAAVYLIWDQSSAYYLMSGGDPVLRSSGATSLLMWEAIQFSSTVTKKFDFEGSMIEPVERFFRAFGAKQVPYFSVKKHNSFLPVFEEFAKKMIKKVIYKK